MAFEGLTEKINNTFKKLRGKGRLKEEDVKDAMREIRLLCWKLTSATRSARTLPSRSPPGVWRPMFWNLSPLPR